jgi:hypothetical protein
VTQVVEHLLCKSEVMSSNPRTTQKEKKSNGNIFFLTDDGMTNQVEIIYFYTSHTETCSSGRNMETES